jgi:prevent-host-death family protein
MSDNTVGAYEAKTHLPQLLERVSRGEQITITKHGVPVAVLVPASKPAGYDAVTAVLEIKKFRKKHKLKGLTIRQMIEEGRRF